MTVMLFCCKQIYFPLKLQSQIQRKFLDCYLHQQKIQLGNDIGLQQQHNGLIHTLMWRTGRQLDWWKGKVIRYKT